MPQFRKKPVVIDAVKIVYSEMIEGGPEDSPFAEITPWIREAIHNGTLTLSMKGARDYAVVDVHTLKGVMEAIPGDFLIRGVKGELYPIKADIFSETYEPVAG